MGLCKQSNNWHILELTLLGLCCLICQYEVNAHVLVYRRLTNQLIEEYNDLPAQFGGSLPPNGIKVFSLPIEEFGCNNISPPPTNFPAYPPQAKFVALISRGGNCSFERKVRNAQSSDYSAVIVYNNEGDDLEQMSAKNSTGIHIPSVFVGHTTGINLRSFQTPDILLVINDELPFNINTQLILPFSILIGLCFLIMVFYMIYKCIREQRRLRRYRLPKRMLKKIPILRYTKNNTDLAYETCVICLEDFADGDKVRVLPCRHPYHSHCIDPWLTENRRVCPICKRKVFTKGEARSNRNRQPSLDSVTDTDDDTTPLLQQPNSGGNDGEGGGVATASNADTGAATATTSHGTFRRGSGAAAAVENLSDDENALLAHQSPVHGSRRMNPFDRSPNLPPHLANMLNETQRPIWSRFNFNFLFRRSPTNISVAAPPYLESGIDTTPTDSVAATIRSRSSAASAAVVPTSNNILNPNLSGSFKDDDDEAPHRSIYEPISITTPLTNLEDSAFLQTPTSGGIGVVALPYYHPSVLGTLGTPPSITLPLHTSSLDIERPIIYPNRTIPPLPSLPPLPPLFSRQRPPPPASSTSNINNTNANSSITTQTESDTDPNLFLV